MKALSLSAVLTGILATPAVACDLCAIYAATQAQGESGKGLFLGVAEQFTHFGTLQIEGAKVSNETGQYLNSSVSQVFVGYNVTERFGVQLNTPVIYRSFKRPEGFVIERGRESGVGDISLAGSFVAYRKLTERFTVSWSVLSGVKLPTGSTERLKEELNEMDLEDAPKNGIHGHDLTLGAGSVDGIVGTAFFTRWKRLFLAASTQYAIRSKGDFDYRFANDLTWLGGPGIYAMLGHEYTLAIQAVVSGESKGRDTFRGGKAEDTGVTAVYLGPQVSFTWKTKLRAEMGVDLPLSIDNTALQAVPDFRVHAGLIWRF